MLNVFRAQNRSVVPKILAVVGLLVLVGIAVITFWSTRNMTTASKWRRHSQAVRYEARSLSASIEATKASLYELALQPKLVTAERFKTANQQLLRNINTLYDLVVDNSAQAEKVVKIRRLVADRSPYWESFAQDFIRKRTPVYRQDFSSLLSLTNTAEIDAILGTFEAEEDFLLMKRAERAEKSFELTSTAVISALAIAFIMFFISNALLQFEIQRREKIEKELELARAKSIEASDLKSSFLANMSHEIRTPLNGIIGMSKLLEHTSLTAKQTDYVETIKTSSNSLLALINDILDFSKIESGKFQLEETNFELKSLLKSAVSIVDYSAKAKGLAIHITIDGNVPDFLVGDPLRLRQVLLNLLNNAIKFSETGTIKISVQNLLDKDDEAVLLQFQVIDQGVGFDSDTRSKLFQSFSQGDTSTSRRYGGTGLGLAISKQIIELMKGKIDVESTKGVGSKFFFDVKLKRSTKDIPSQSVSKLPGNEFLTGNILVAEDNRVNQKVVGEMISLMGCQYRMVENGRDTIETLKRERFDLILMDAQMPIMDGYEATRRIRAGDAGDENKIIPILATTANAIKGDIELCLEAGMNDYISKPILYSDLVVKVSKWMARGQTIVDDASLQRLRDQGDKSGKEILSVLVDIFKQDAPNAVSLMRQNLRDRQMQEIPAIAHNFKTSAGILGAIRLKELAERIERSQSEPITDQQLIHLIESLENELKLVISHLDKEVQSQKPQPPPEASP